MLRACGEPPRADADTPIIAAAISVIDDKSTAGYTKFVCW